MSRSSKPVGALHRENPHKSLMKVEDFLGIYNFNYEPDMLTSVVNQGPVINIPQNLVEAARPFVEDELNALDRLGIPIPQSYWQPLEQTRTEQTRKRKFKLFWQKTPI
ncbi:hypothetical protein [Komagataeibacter sp. FNDCF1]|uniref:hypothetical protein n=1 Tax=Komagataeibacter sp. FNDCF1 TaxID=2878681 RepID=UPI001E311D18|nr:hypothetical protein [Komagataeibacter sp. FNDCF1]MCE2566152.1 hypothetical protein [Komagataeibacter sp. FNDCF1]